MKSKIILGIAVITFFILSGCTEKTDNSYKTKVENCEIVTVSKGSIYMECDGNRLSHEEATLYYEVYQKEKDGQWYIEVPQLSKDGVKLIEYKYVD